LNLNVQVNVAKRNGLLEVSIVCANRPGLLVEIMEAIESAGLTIMYTRIACHDEIVVEHLSIEVKRMISQLCTYCGIDAIFDLEFLTQGC